MTGGVMNVVITTCLIIITVSFVLLVLQLIDTLKQIKNTAFQVEKLAVNANERLNDIQPVFHTVNSLTGAVTSGWAKLVAIITGLFRREN